MTRLRHLAAISLAALLGLGLTAASASAEPAADPRAPVERLHAALLDTMQRADALGFEGRVAALDPVVAGTYDLGFMSAKVLGRRFETLSAEDQARWRALFRRYTVATYADRFSGFSGERFETLGDEAGAYQTAVVKTRLHPHGEAPVELDYRLRSTPQGYRIIDVYLNGTVSELALRRADYSSLLRRKGFAELVAAVEEKIAQARGGTSAPRTP